MLMTLHTKGQIYLFKLSNAYGAKNWIKMKQYRISWIFNAIWAVCKPFSGTGHTITRCVEQTTGTVYPNNLRRCETCQEPLQWMILNRPPETKAKGPILEWNVIDFLMETNMWSTRRKQGGLGQSPNQKKQRDYVNNDTINKCLLNNKPIVGNITVAEYSEI